MAAIVELGGDWWGAMVAWCEASRARRSCLLLCVLRPGAAAAPWLGPLDQLGAGDKTSTCELTRQHAGPETLPNNGHPYLQGHRRIRYKKINKCKETVHRVNIQHF